ncbi:aspartyl protease family protein [Hymenobacter lapidiphilus]|uniref:Aspartyl protease family protein n=1 Tax=Hymenobacter lapidiphilus TaxID=2608003 RepID=A0A7Y7U474_9BACT|nr:aspartyl protease family protein [Hymenobacter lapidiphilus]NVO30118.1 aspartyl protease family protein [Hymenobacter lapidiphilus]
MPLRIGALLRAYHQRRSWQLSWLLLLLGLMGPVVSGRGQISEPVFRLLRPRARQAKVPFALQRNLIVIEARLNGQGPYNFLLDTGLASSLITDPAVGRELNLATTDRFLVSGAGEESALEAFRVPSVAVQLSGQVGATRASFLMLSEDVLNISGYVGVPVHGLLGADVFRNLVVQVDTEKQMLEFHDPARYRAPRGRRWARLPLEFDGAKAFLNLPVQLSDSLQLPLRLVLDTGAGHALSIETTSDPRLRVPPARLRTQLGRGLNGNINGFLGRVPGLQLGRYRIRNLLTSYPDSADVAGRAETFRNGNLGFELLKRFTTIIDYPHNQLLLKPNSLFRDPFEHDMCGFDLLAFGPGFQRYRLLRIEPGGPAEQAGLKVNDEIISINLIPAEFFSLTDISRMLHSADGRLLLFVVRRAGTTELQTARVRLTRRI